jgi:hypothetical protein
VSVIGPYGQDQENRGHRQKRRRARQDRQVALLDDHLQRHRHRHGQQDLPRPLRPEPLLRGGGIYNLVKRNTSGTDGNRRGNVTRWEQFCRIRKTGRQCGTISITEHFEKWDSMGWKLGNLLEANIVVEAACGVGNVEFPVADVTTTQ